MVDGFDATWTKARETFGESPPLGGESFDRAFTLRELQSRVDAAKPDGWWSGSYAAANAQQGRVTLKDVVVPPPNGWGERPPLVLQEAYRFRVTGEHFDGEPDHVQWVERNGTWYQATWVDYSFEAEHVQQMAGKISFPWGMNDWAPVDIQDIYAKQVDNPRLNPYGVR
jgi:hypothetical protein